MWRMVSNVLVNSYLLTMKLKSIVNNPLQMNDSKDYWVKRGDSYFTQIKCAIWIKKYSNCENLRLSKHANTNLYTDMLEQRKFIF